MKRIHARLEELGFEKKSVSDGLVIYFDVGDGWRLWPNSGHVGVENDLLGVKFTLSVCDAARIDVVDNHCLIFRDSCGGISASIGLSGIISAIEPAESCLTPCQNTTINDHPVQHRTLFDFSDREGQS